MIKRSLSSKFKRAIELDLYFHGFYGCLDSSTDVNFATVSVWHKHTSEAGPFSQRV